MDAYGGLLLKTIRRAGTDALQDAQVPIPIERLDNKIQFLTKICGSLSCVLWLFVFAFYFFEEISELLGKYTAAIVFEMSILCGTRHLISEK